jgi:hypothetical protein
MQADYNIDTEQVLRLIHDAEELVPRIPAELRPELEQSINCALGVLTFHLRTRTPVVSKAHADAVMHLVQHIRSIKEPQHELASTISP